VTTCLWCAGSARRVPLNTSCPWASSDCFAARLSFSAYSPAAVVPTFASPRPWCTPCRKPAMGSARHV